MLIPPELFQEKKPTVMIELPFFFRNEKVSKTFISKLYDYAQNKFDFRIKWVTKKVKSLFQLKDRNPYPHASFIKVYVVVAMIMSKKRVEILPLDGVNMKI